MPGQFRGRLAAISVNSPVSFEICRDWDRESRANSPRAPAAVEPFSSGFFKPAKGVVMTGSESSGDGESDFCLNAFSHWSSTIWHFD